VGERRGRRWGRGGGGGGGGGEEGVRVWRCGWVGAALYIISAAAVGWWAVLGLALARVKFRLSAKNQSVPRVKLSAEVTLVKINFKNSKMM
jgi:hypothetical protein